MKHKYFLILLLALAVVLAGCGQQAPPEEDDTIFEPVDMDEPAEGEAEAEAEAEAEDEPAEGEAEAEAEAEAEEEPDPLEGINVEKVMIEDLKFIPKEITVPAGTMVIWEHKDRFKDRDDIRHMLMIYYVDSVRSEKFTYGETFNMTFNESGEYSYIDILYKATMRGKVIVE